MSPIATYLERLSTLAEDRLRRSARVIEEIEAHLIDAAERYRQQGLESVEAERRSIADFGEPDGLIESFEDLEKGAPAVPSPFTRLAGLLGMAGVFMFGIGAGGNGLSSHNQISIDLPWSEIWFVGAMLMLVAVAGIVVRGWGRLGKPGRFAAIAFPIGALTAALGGYSFFAGIGLGLIAAAATAVTARLVRLGVLALLPVLLFSAGIVAAGVYAMVGVTGDGVQVIPPGIMLGGWLWVCYTMWSERPERLRKGDT